MGLKLNRFTILLAKNTLHLFRNYPALITVFLIPVAFLGILFYVQIKRENINEVEKIVHPEFTVTPLNEEIIQGPKSHKHIIFYSPTTGCKVCSDLVSTFQENVAAHLKYTNFEFIGFKSYHEMVKHVQTLPLFDFLCGLSLVENKNVTSVNDLNPKIIFPNELRTVQWINPLQKNLFQWTLDRMTRDEVFDKWEPASENIKVGEPDYYSELALAVIFLLERTLTKLAIIEKHIYTFNIDSYKYPDLKMQRFTEIKSKVNHFLFVFRPFLGIFIMFCVIGNNMLLLKMISWEKQKQLKEFMHVAGLDHSVYWISWYCFSCLVSLPFIMFVFLSLTTRLRSDIEPLFVHSQISLIFWIFALYTCASVSFLFLISSIFSDTYVAMRVGGLVYVFTALPYFIIQGYAILPFPLIFFFCLFFHMPMAIALDMICRSELHNVGISFENISESFLFHKNVNLIFIMLILVFNSVFYLVLAFYIDAVFPRYGVGKKWNFFLFFWKNTHINTVAESSEFNDFHTNIKKNRCLVRMMNLTKEKGMSKNKVLNKVTIDIYENELTVIYGKDGSGKSTMAGILVGSVLPTSGDIAITGLNVLTERKQIRTNIGYCPQVPILFDYLTTEEHLLFFGYLRGLPTRKATSEANYYIKMLKLESVKNILVKNISHNLQRMLCLALALCGGPRIVILDEPTVGFGMDKLNTIWNLLRMEKEGRSVIVMTWSQEEALTIADRIAVMKRGTVKSYGNKKFISACYNLEGYFLRLDKGLGFTKKHFESAKEAILKIIPSAFVETNNKQHSIYRISNKSRDKLSELCKTIVKKKRSWRILDYAVYTAGIEEHRDNFFKEEKLRVMETLKPPLDLSQYKKGIMGRFLVVLRKHIMVDFIEWTILALKVIAPLGTVFLLPFLLSYKSEPLVLSMEEYNFSPTPIILVEDNEQFMTELLMGFMDEQNERGINVKIVERGTMEKSLNDIQKHLGRHHVLYGLEYLNDNAIKCWFNGKIYLHVSGLCASKIFPFASSQTQFETFPHKIFEPGGVGGDFVIIQGLFLAASSLFSIVIMETCYSNYYFNEEMSKFRSFQILCGVRKKDYWLSAFIWDIITYFIIVVILIFVLFSFNLPNIQTYEDLIYCGLFFTIFGFCFLPKVYLFTYVYKFSYALGFTGMILYTIITGVFGFYLNTNVLKPSLMITISPYYCFGLTLFTSFYWNRRNNYCDKAHRLCELYPEQVIANIPKNLTTSAKLNFCKDNLCSVTSCCDIKERFWVYFLPPIFSFLCSGLFFFIILTIIEAYKHKFRQEEKGKKKFYYTKSVYREKQAVLKLSNMALLSKGIVLKNVNKISSRPPNLYNMFLVCDFYQCSGLLGPEGSGKTLMFDVLVNNTERTSGEIWIARKMVTGHNTRSKLCSYGPQKDTLAPFLSVKFIIMYICQVKGYTHRDSKTITKLVTEYFDLTDFLNYKVKNVSRDVKRKVHNALAFVGNSPILLFDEPTIGTDIGYKTLLWRQLEASKAKSCILLASNDLEETLTICTKTAVVYRGEAIWIGEPSRIKQLFSGGVVLEINFIYEPDFLKFKSYKKEFIAWMDEVFKESLLLQDIFDILLYYIPNFVIQPSLMFELMEEAANKYKIETYVMREINLAQMFSLFVTDYHIKNS